MVFTIIALEKFLVKLTSICHESGPDTCLRAP